MTNKAHEAGIKAWETRKWRIAQGKAALAEAASKEALRQYCKQHGWHVAFFESKTGAPLTGIIDAITFRIAKGRPDVLDLRLVQLKGGKAGVSGREITRLKQAASAVEVNWLVATLDAENHVLHLLPADLEEKKLA
jgi:hypothetical protein